MASLAPALRTNWSRGALPAPFWLLLTIIGLLGGCSSASHVQKQEAAIRDCTHAFVEVTPTLASCGFVLSPVGSLAYDGRKIGDFSAVVYNTQGGGSTTIPADRAVLFPPSSSGRYRIIEACLKGNTSCFETAAFDRDAGLSKTVAGETGPDRWQRWSPDEQFVALVSHRDDGESIYVIEAANGRSFEFPVNVAQEHWRIQRDSFEWIASRKFAVAVGRCSTCAVAREEFGF